jgi:hypothetical protein
MEPAAGVERLVEAEVEGEKVPVVLARGSTFWLNTYSPSNDCWEAIMPRLTGTPLHTGVLFRSYSHAQRADGLHSDQNARRMTIGDEPLPVQRVRLIAPPELDRPLLHALPLDWQRASLQTIRTTRPSTPYPAPGVEPPSILLQPGEVVDFVFPRDAK